MMTLDISMQCHCAKQDNVDNVLRFTIAQIIAKCFGNLRQIQDYYNLRQALPITTGIANQEVVTTHEGTGSGAKSFVAWFPREIEIGVF